MKKSFFRVGFAAATLLLLAVMGGGCSLELNNEDERAALYDTAGLLNANGFKILSANTFVSDVSSTTGLTLCFHGKGTVADDQLILFSGVSDSKNVTVRTGYLGDWAAWDSGINDASATGGTLADGSYNVMKNAFTGDDGCAFVFKVESDTTSSIYYYINGELALAWENVESTFCNALIDALSTNGLGFVDNSASSSSTLAYSGKVYYAPTVLDSEIAKTFSTLIKSE